MVRRQICQLDASGRKELVIANEKGVWAVLRKASKAASISWLVLTLNTRRSRPNLWAAD